MERGVGSFIMLAINTNIFNFNPTRFSLYTVVSQLNALRVYNLDCPNELQTA